MQDIKQSSFRFGSFRTVVLLSVHGICTCTLCIVRKTASMRESSFAGKSKVNKEASMEHFMVP